MPILQGKESHEAAQSPALLYTESHACERSTLEDLLSFVTCTCLPL